MLSPTATNIVDVGLNKEYKTWIPMYKHETLKEKNRLYSLYFKTRLRSRIVSMKTAEDEELWGKFEDGNENI